LPPGDAASAVVAYATAANPSASMMLRPLIRNLSIDASVAGGAEAQPGGAAPLPWASVRKCPRLPARDPASKTRGASLLVHGLRELLNVAEQVVDLRPAVFVHTERVASRAQTALEAVGIFDPTRRPRNTREIDGIAWRAAAPTAPCSARWGEPDDAARLIAWLCAPTTPGGSPAR
jgi:hypothetical protein